MYFRMTRCNCSVAGLTVAAGWLMSDFGLFLCQLRQYPHLGQSHYVFRLPSNHLLPFSNTLTRRSNAAIRCSSVDGNVGGNVGDVLTLTN